MPLEPLSYEEHGAGPAVVLIHGHPFDRSMWRPQLAALGERFRVVAEVFNRELLGFLDRAG